MSDLTSKTPNKAPNTLMNVSRAVSKLITAFAVQRIIKQQIDSSNYATIDLSTFNHVANQLVDKNPDLRAFTEKLSSYIDQPRLRERIKTKMLYKKARDENGSPLTEDERKKP